MQRIPSTFLALLVLLGLGATATAQDTPLLSGSVGFVTSTTRGGTTYIPLIQPVGVLPLGDRLLLESRAGLLELITPTSTGHDHSRFIALTYLQGDYIATPHLTIVAGSFLLPFGTYNERLTPLWIGNFQNESVAEPIGQMVGSPGTELEFAL